MKDSYSLDVDHDALQVSYQKHIAAYDRIYERCGIDCMMVEEDPGMMGGTVSHAYMAYAEAGEDEIVFCRRCGYAANVELAVAGPDPEAPLSETAPRTESVDLLVDEIKPTPAARTIAEVGDSLGLPARAFMKALVVVTERGDEAGKPVMVLLRGDHDLNELKLRNLLGADFRLATPDEVLAAQGVEPGFVGPVPTELPVYADRALTQGCMWPAPIAAATIVPASASIACRRPPWSTSARCAPASLAELRRRARRGASDRSGQHLPARHQVLAPDGRYLLG